MKIQLILVIAESNDIIFTFDNSYTGKKLNLYPHSMPLPDMKTHMYLDKRDITPKRFDHVIGYETNDYGDIKVGNNKFVCDGFEIDHISIDFSEDTISIVGAIN